MLFGSNEKLLKYNKSGLIPAIIQHAENHNVLLFVYLNKEAVKRTRKTGDLWLYYRSKKKVWRKGSHSGRTIKVVDILVHHDRNILLIKAIPNGPACHTGNETCFIESCLAEQQNYSQSGNNGVAVDIDRDDGLDALRKLFAAQDLNEEVDIVAKPSGDKSEDMDEIPTLDLELEEKNAGMQKNLLDDIYSNILQKLNNNQTESYTAKMADLGSEKIAQKVGENAMQLMLSVSQKDLVGMVKKEAEMLHHMLILLAEKRIKLKHLHEELHKRTV